MDAKLIGRFWSLSFADNFLLPIPAMPIKPKPIRIIIAGSELNLCEIKFIGAYSSCGIKSLDSAIYDVAMLMHSGIAISTISNDPRIFIATLKLFI